MDTCRLVANAEELTKQDVGQLDCDPPAYVVDDDTSSSLWSSPPPAYTSNTPPPYSSLPSVMGKTAIMTETSGTPVFRRRVLRVSDNSPIKDYMWLSVMNMFFFFPLAVVGVMLSLKVRDCLGSRDFIRAREVSRTCFLVNMIATVIGVMTIIGIIVGGMVGFEPRDV
ncbi:uncharacterized protein LOC134192994 [Corticium candelabrum]|uniref:uncharacterized protein LOC134192994 n=1 Tax=Corticium candelabrum TaxID=121492 RepID=UPI002E27069C|nr:uncharacterized protein LOC134192994 [Corticium candelabrum]